MSIGLEYELGYWDDEWLGESDRFSLARVPEYVRRLLRYGSASLAIRLAIARGMRDENELANMVFFARHPERNGRKIRRSEPNFSELSREWLMIRDRLVRPVLTRYRHAAGPSTGPTTPTRPTSPVTTSAPCEFPSRSIIRCGPCQTQERRLRSAPPPHLVRVPVELLTYRRRSERLDQEALQAYQRMYRAARAAGMPSPYLKLKSGFRDYDRQAGLWRPRLRNVFRAFDCGGVRLTCIESAIDRTSRALRGEPVPHSKNAWLEQFRKELRRLGCVVDCDPARVEALARRKNITIRDPRDAVGSAVRILRRGTAPPGSSPHHTGRALDLYVGSELSTKASNVRFQRKQPAFKWLVCNAARFGFYPYNHEPWHWEYNPPSGARESEWELDFGV